MRHTNNQDFPKTVNHMYNSWQINKDNVVKLINFMHWFSTKKGMLWLIYDQVVIQHHEMIYDDIWLWSYVIILIDRSKFKSKVSMHINCWDRLFSSCLRMIYNLSICLICFSFSKPLLRGFWQILKVIVVIVWIRTSLNLHRIVRVLKTEGDIVEVLVCHGALRNIVNAVFVRMESFLRSWNNFGN